MRRVLELMVDEGSLLEIQPKFVLKVLYLD